MYPVPSKKAIKKVNMATSLHVSAKVLNKTVLVCPFKMYYCLFRSLYHAHQIMQPLNIILNGTKFGMFGRVIYTEIHNN